MTANATTLISLALPKERGAQFAWQGALAVAGTLLLTLSAKTNAERIDAARERLQRQVAGLAGR